MNSARKEPSAFTKMKQAYWEAKQSFNKAVGQREDNHVISSDSELDLKLDLLQAADSSFNELMKVTLDYRDALQDLVKFQESFGLALIEYGTKDCTAAGKIMCVSGKAISKAAQRQSQLKTHLMNVFYEVQTFQFKATSDALQTVGKMEKARKSYRSGLMWLKDESENLDPDVGKKLRNFKKVQQQIKHLKTKFDGAKLKSMQKIDLFLLSRANLFSHTLATYCRSFKKMSKSSSLYMDHALKTIPHCLSYNFVALKELNQYSKLLLETLQQQRSSDQTPEKHDKSKARPKESKLAGDSVLIDFNDDRKANQSSERCNTVGASSGYSEDLRLINFGDCRPSYASELSMINFGNEFRKPTDSISRSSAGKDSSSDLRFWSLIKSHEKTSKLSKADNPDMKAPDLILPKQSSITSPESKWNQLLVQFDPFLEEMPNRKSYARGLEPC